MSNILIANKGDYSLECGISPEDNQPCYLLINKETKVVEVETKILPQGYKYLEELSAGLDMAKDLHKEDL